VTAFEPWTLLAFYAIKHERGTRGDSRTSSAKERRSSSDQARRRGRGIDPPGEDEAWLWEARPESVRALSCATAWRRLSRTSSRNPLPSRFRRLAWRPGQESNLRPAA